VLISGFCPLPPNHRRQVTDLFEGFCFYPVPFAPTDYLFKITGLKAGQQPLVSVKAKGALLDAQAAAIDFSPPLYYLLRDDVL